MKKKRKNKPGAGRPTNKSLGKETATSVLPFKVTPAERAAFVLVAQHFGYKPTQLFRHLVATLAQDQGDFLADYIAKRGTDIPGLAEMVEEARKRREAERDGGKEPGKEK